MRPPATSYPEAIERLYELRHLGSKLGLENTIHLAALLGNPQDRLSFIHVAGTNGKGSTCAFLESIYRNAGLKVGLFTSPHLISFTERLQVDRRRISETDVVRLVAEVESKFDDFAPDLRPTFFETVTGMALRYFEEQRCDVVIWETGLGGRLDSTNIVTPLVSVITNVDLDHEKLLGETIEKIAWEKAGIIKPGIPVITGADHPAAIAVLEARARELGSPLRRIDRTRSFPWLNSGRLGLEGPHQVQNAALAVAVAETLAPRWPISRSRIGQALESTQWPARMQRVEFSDGRTWLIDGAHNPAGVRALRQSLRDGNRPFSPTALVVGILRDKDWQSMGRELAGIAPRILVVPVDNERTTSAEELASAFRQQGGSVEIFSSLAAALEAAAREKHLLITGSLYLAGEALRYLDPSCRDERHLNEKLTSP